MDASQYKDYVLVLLFLKVISDKYAAASPIHRNSALPVIGVIWCSWPGWWRSTPLGSAGRSSIGITQAKALPLALATTVLWNRSCVVVLWSSATAGPSPSSGSDASHAPPGRRVNLRTEMGRAVLQQGLQRIGLAVEHP
jgi:hypothetical protein